MSRSSNNEFNTNARNETFVTNAIGIVAVLASPFVGMLVCQLLADMIK